MPPLLPQPAEACHVDHGIWSALAGSCVQIPPVGSRVYYFPQGHLEQSFSSFTNNNQITISTPNLTISTPSSFSCQISSLHLLADPVTDEVYAKLLLLPIGHQSSSSPISFLKGNLNILFNEEENEREKVTVTSFAKVLTPSDANNGGGFSVPRFCADSIFPPLNYSAEPPVQTLKARDIHGVRWEFRHIYRGTPRRHLLTTGWSKFVNHKKLVAGDSVVFMRDLEGEMFIGVRRSVRYSGDYARWRHQIGGRSGRERMTREAVEEAVERAARGLPFEVMYYPKAGWYSDFVVRAEVVEASLNVYWRPGMRVKMAMETEDSCRMTWFQGTVAAAGVLNCGSWCGSHWRMLQVTWDEPEVLQNFRRVSPWQVEYVAPTASIDAAFPNSKKFKFPENSGFLTDGGTEKFFPMSGLTNSTVDYMSPSLLNYKNFPASMQGARQGLFSTIGVPNLYNDPQMSFQTPFAHNVVPKWRTLSTDLNVGSPQSDHLSPDSQSSVHSFASELVENQGYNSSKVGISSIQLFGKIIHMNQPAEGGFDNVVYMEDDDSKGTKVKEGVDSPLDLSSTSSYTELLTRTNDQSAA